MSGSRPEERKDGGNSLGMAWDGSCVLCRPQVFFFVSFSNVFSDFPIFSQLLQHKVTSAWFIWDVNLHCITPSFEACSCSMHSFSLHLSLLFFMNWWNKSVFWKWFYDAKDECSPLTSVIFSSITWISCNYFFLNIT